jgi:hypothetical protein
MQLRVQAAFRASDEPPFAIVARTNGATMAHLPFSAPGSTRSCGSSDAWRRSSDDAALLRDIRWAIDAINRTVGGRFTCLMQAMAGKVMLNRH